MAAMKNKCNNDILLLPRASRVFTTVLQSPVLPIQSSVIAIFMIPLKYDKRYGPSHQNNA